MAGFPIGSRFEGTPHVAKNYLDFPTRIGRSDTDYQRLHLQDQNTADVTRTFVLRDRTLAEADVGLWRLDYRRNRNDAFHENRLH